MIPAEIQPTRIPEECKREVSLWAAVMSQAIKDYRSIDDQGARYWVWSDDTNLGSFIWICELFNLNPDFAREKIQNA